MLSKKKNELVNTDVIKREVCYNAALLVAEFPFLLILPTFDVRRNILKHLNP